MVQKKVANCVNCGTQETALWRKDGNGNCFCNACGLFKKMRGVNRPMGKSPIIKKKTLKKPCSFKCVNCKTTKTTIWRRNVYGEIICNACGLYYKLHNVSRPVPIEKELSDLKIMSKL